MRILPKCKNEDGKHKFGTIKNKKLRKKIDSKWEQCQNEGCFFLVDRNRYERVKKIRVNKN